MVYWIEPLTLDQRVAGSIPVNAWGTFVLQQDTLSTLLLSTQVYLIGNLVGERYLLLDVARVRPFSGP